jgi:hypothetical protein
MEVEDEITSRHLRGHINLGKKSSEGLNVVTVGHQRDTQSGVLYRPAKSGHGHDDISKFPVAEYHQMERGHDAAPSLFDSTPKARRTASTCTSSIEGAVTTSASLGA